MPEQSSFAGLPAPLRLHTMSINWKQILTTVALAIVGVGLYQNIIADKLPASVRRILG